MILSTFPIQIETQIRLQGHIKSIINRSANENQISQKRENIDNLTIDEGSCQMSTSYRRHSSYQRFHVDPLIAPCWFFIQMTHKVNF